MTTVQTNTVSSDLLKAMNPATSSTQSTADAAQDRFMTLLVTQMKNQDPLNPLDNAQVTSQLAQLSTVTGIDKLNATLSSLMGSYQSSQSLQAASMIGHSVLVPGSSMTLTDGQALLGVDLAAPADSVKLSVFDSTGKQVHSIDLGKQEAGVQPFKWDGTTDDGTAAADGKYTFKVVATSAGQSVGATALSFGQVGSVSTGSSGVKLNVPDIGTVSMADVRQIL
jgi:flagellar basal-body rod modification protein FlgD